MQPHSKPSKLMDVLPNFAAELERLLLNQGEPGLAEQIAELRIIDRCRYGDDFCGSFYTQPKPQGAYGPDHWTIDLSQEKGMLMLDVVGDKVAFVEVLCRSEIRKVIQAAVP